MKKPMKMKKAAPAKMAKKSPARKPSDLEVGNRKNLPPELKAKIAADFIKKSAPIILDLKKYHNRKRPYELDKKLKAIVLKSMQTPSYPSGHSVQGTGIAKMLADKYPKAKSAFLQTGKNISYSRRVAHAHYLSDSKDGDQLGIKMYNHTKNN